MASASAPQIPSADSIERGMMVAPFTVSRSVTPLGLVIRGARVVVNVLIACWTILFYDTLASSMEDNHGSLVRTFLAMFLYIGLPNRAYEEFDQVFRKMRLSDVQLKTLARTEGPLTSPAFARAEHIWKDFTTRDERVAYGTTGGCCIGVSAACIQYLSDTSLRHHHILSRLHILSMFIVLEALVLKLVLYKCVQGAMQERRHMWMWRTAMHPLVRPGALWNEWIALTMPLVLAYW
ncbi:hypothetical protein CPC08DRAFT_219754 [Agrocybe pediades]|nr:hypothetical protein CPC08DRAFT_219754 [Agrocybe pediades]